MGMGNLQPARLTEENKEKLEEKFQFILKFLRSRDLRF